MCLHSEAGVKPGMTSLRLLCRPCTAAVIAGRSSPRTAPPLARWWAACAACWRGLPPAADEQSGAWRCSGKARPVSRSSSGEGHAAAGCPWIGQNCVFLFLLSLECCFHLFPSAPERRWPGCQAPLPLPFSCWLPSCQPHATVSFVLPHRRRSAELCKNVSCTHFGRRTLACSWPAAAGASGGAAATSTFGAQGRCCAYWPPLYIDPPRLRAALPCPSSFSQPAECFRLQTPECKAMCR